MGNNFTAIDEINPVAATGDLFNDVYEEFDGAIGDRSLLTTTDATAMADNIPLVTAIRRVYTQLVAAAASITTITAAGWVTATRLATDAVTSIKIQAGAVTTAKIAASAVTDNELASNAVTTAKITNLNVTGGKIARDAFAPPNAFVDATFQITPLKIAAEWGINGHTFRWFPRSQASLDDTAVIVFDDTNNPMGVRQRTVRFKGTSAGNLFGWYISLAEAGWKAGDVISGAVYCNAPSGTFALDVRCAGPSGTLLGSLQLGTGQVFSGTPLALNISGATIDAGAAYVIYLVSRNAGTSDCDLYWRYAGPGLLIPQVPSAQGYLPNQGVTRKKDADGSHLLPDYSAQANKILSADGTSQVDVVYLADSWGQRLIIAPVLRAWLQAQYGDGGLGWVSFYMTYNQGSSYWEGLSATGGANVRSGSWTDSARAAGSMGPDITHISTLDSAATMKITTTVTFTAVDILTAKQTAGGTYEYRIDGGAWVPISTAGAAGVLVTSITGLSAATHVIDFQVNTIGVDGLVFLGLNIKKSGNGARLHRLAIASSTAAHWASVDATVWQQGIAALTPNLVIPSLATNDKTANTPPQTHAASLATVIQRIWTARALTDILIFTPCDVTDSGGTTYQSAQYASAQRTLASSLDVAYYDGYALMPVNSEAVSRGMMEPLSGGNSRHPLLPGGRYLANGLINRFLRIP